MDDLYREYILEHYNNPLNFGQLEDPTFEAEGQNPTCGDELHVQVRLSADGATIDEVRFTGQGCAISQAAMSILSERLTGMPVEELAGLDRDWMLELLGIQLSPARIKCGVLGMVVVRTGWARHSGSAAPDGWEGMDELAWSGGAG